MLIPSCVWSCSIVIITNFCFDIWQCVKNKAPSFHSAVLSTIIRVECKWWIEFKAWKDTTVSWKKLLKGINRQQRLLYSIIRMLKEEFLENGLIWRRRKGCFIKIQIRVQNHLNRWRFTAWIVLRIVFVFTEFSGFNPSDLSLFLDLEERNFVTVKKISAKIWYILRQRTNHTTKMISKSWKNNIIGISPPMATVLNNRKEFYKTKCVFL